MLKIRQYYAKMKLKGTLMKCFKEGDMHKKVKRGDKTFNQYPRIRDVQVKNNEDGEPYCIQYVFTIPTGMDPDAIKGREWLFKQTFGPFIELKGKLKKFTLNVYINDLSNNIKYDYKQIEPHLKKKTIPILCGMDIDNNINVMDLSEEHHLLLTGSTGSGKSSLIRAMLVSMMLHKSPDEIRFVLGDLKFSEFGVFRRIPHVVDQIHMEARTLLPALEKIDKELERRGKLLDQHDVENITELKEKLPFIIVCIDEVILLKDNKKIMKIIERISCVGRSNGIFLVLAMQRGDAKTLGGQLKNNLIFRISGRQSDEVNAKISGIKKSAEIEVTGRMILTTKDGEKEIQVPFMSKSKAKEILAPYKIDPVPEEEEQEEEPPKANEFKLDEVFDDE